MTSRKGNGKLFGGKSGTSARRKRERVAKWKVNRSYFDAKKTGGILRSKTLLNFYTKVHPIFMVNHISKRVKRRTVSHKTFLRWLIEKNLAECSWIVNLFLEVSNSIYSLEFVPVNVLMSSHMCRCLCSRLCVTRKKKTFIRWMVQYLLTSALNKLIHVVLSR